MTRLFRARDRDRRKKQKKRRGIRFHGREINNGYREARWQWQLDTSFTAVFHSGFSFSGWGETTRPTPRRQASLRFDDSRGTTFCLRSSSKESVSLRPGSIRRVMAGPFVDPLAFEKPRVAFYSLRGKFSGVLSIHYGFTFLLRNLSLSFCSF